MRSVISLILVYCLAITSVFAQSVNPNDTLKIGKASSSSDKGLTFDTNDGVSNKKLLIEKISKKLKFDGNTFQIGDGSSSSDKELIIAGALKSLKYNGTSGEFEFNDDVKLSGTLKADFLQAVNTEVAINSLLRASQGIKVGAGANEIRVNAGNLEFSNDGVLYKKFGTGSGSGSTGVNLLANDSFEDGISTGWTSSGGTFSQQTYTNSLEGDTKYARFISSGAGQYIESSAVLITDSMTGGCQADFKKYNTVTGSAFKVQAISGASTVLAEQTLSAGSWVKAPTISFVCPSSGTSVKLRLISLAAGTIQFDKGYIGSNQSIGSGATIIRQDIVRLDGFTSYSGGNYKLTTVTTNTNNYITADNAGAFTKIVALKPVVGLKLTFTSVHNLAQNAVNNIVRYNSANTVLESWQGQQSTASSSVGGGTLTINTDMNVGDYIAVGDQNGTATITGASVFARLDSVVQSETSVSPEQSSWFIDANIGGASINANNNNSSYLEITNASLDMVINGSKGSANAEIPCSGTNPSTGLTCAAGNESLGVSFIPLVTGRHRVCIAFSPYQDSGGATTTNATFQVVKTPNNAQTILEEGADRAYFYVKTANTGSANYANVCGNFNVTDLSKQTFRLMNESSSPTSAVILADRSGAEGQRDIHVTVENVTFGQNRPVLTGDQVTSKGIANPKLFTASVSSTGVVTNDYSDFINGNCVMSGGGSSTATCTYNSGIFTTYSACWAPTPPPMIFAGVTNIGSTVNAVVHMQAPNGVDTATAFQLFCWGF